MFPACIRAARTAATPPHQLHLQLCATLSGFWATLAAQNLRELTASVADHCSPPSDIRCYTSSGTAVQHPAGYEYEVPQRPEQRGAHGRTWHDPYSWMERGGMQFEAHLAAEARRAEAALQPLAPLRRQLLREMMGSLPMKQSSPPECLGGHEYWTEQSAEAPRPQLMRRRLPDGQPRVLLDANEDAAFDDGDLGTVKLSPSGGRIAFTVLTDPGSEALRAYVRELPIGCAIVWDLAEIEDVGTLEWLSEEHILFTRPDASGRLHQVVRRQLTGAGSGVDEVLLEEADPSCFLHLGRTKDGALLTINSNSKTSSEVHLMDPGNPTAPPLCVAPRREGVEYFVEHCAALSGTQAPHGSVSSGPAAGMARGSSSSGSGSACAGSGADVGDSGGSIPDDRSLVLLTNHGSTNGEMRLMTAAAGALSSSWQLLHEPAADVAITDVDVFAGSIVLYERRDGRPGVSVLRFDTKVDEADVDEEFDGNSASSAPAGAQAMPMRSPEGYMCEADIGHVTTGQDATPGLLRVQLPGWATSVQPGLNADHAAATLRLRLSSPADPDHHVDFGLEDGAGHLVHREALPPDSQHDPAEYASRRLHARSADGTQVPLTLVHREGLQLDGPAPALLVAYGAYGECLDPDFEVSRLPLLARGWVLAFAHVRGGGELGRRWHAGGRGLLKHRSVDDLEACLDHLIATGVSGAGRVAVEGTSAGGLLAAALVHRRGSDLGAALLRAPFVDLVSTALNPEAPLVAHEASEWGDAAHDAAAFDAMAAVCPYQAALRSVPPQPAVLVTVAADDGRVPAWGPAKWVAALSCGRQQEAGRQPPAGDTAGHSGVGAGDAKGAPLLLLPRQTGGHSGVEQAHIADRSQEYAFVIAACENSSDISSLESDLVAVAAPAEQ